MANAKKDEAIKPDVFAYHDYVKFLVDWIEYAKSTGEISSVRAFGLRCGLSASYLQKVLAGHRGLTVEATSLIAPNMNLSGHELSFFSHLRDLGEAKSQQERMAAFNKILRFSQFRENNKEDLIAKEYLTAWYYFAIREMSHLADFKMDAQWIRAKLKYSVSLTEVRSCLRFLKENSFIEVDEQGSVLAPKRPINCSGGIYRLSLSEFHRQILELGVKSIFDTDRSQRKHLAHTMAIPAHAFEEVQSILDEALAKVQKVSEREHTEEDLRVFQVSLMGFPLTKKEAA